MNQIRDTKGLYNIIQAAERSGNTDDFLTRVVRLLPSATPHPESTHVRITFRGKVFTSTRFRESSDRITEKLLVGAEAAGTLEIHTRPDSPYLDRDNYLTRTLAATISSAVRRLDLEKSHNGCGEPSGNGGGGCATDLAAMQEKLIRAERLAAVGELASGVGHELRNPLNVIRNCAYLLNICLEDNSSEDIRNALDVLDKQVDVADKIVTDLMDFTRLKPPLPQRVDLHALIEESLGYINIPKAVTVKARVNGYSPHIRVDAEQIGRVFTNVITNAIQAMSGAGELEIGTGSDASGVRVTFTDSGCGIPAENIDRVFEPLFTTKSKGIGLGLAISKRLVEQNGGAIEVTSEPGRGTTFTVKLPPEIRRDA